jgi:anti-anti-sigma factor
VKLTTTITDTVAVLAVNGELTLKSVITFRDAIEKLVANPGVNLIEIDLGETRYLDSSALGTLIAARESARRVQKTIALTQCRGSIRQALEIARFDMLFSITP